jgi:AhpD family alkylhydroperoxidase
MTITPGVRIDGPEMRELVPEAMAAMVRFNGTAAKSGLSHELLELVKIRASQLNGCAYCLQMHNNDARKMGIAQAKLDQISAWHESPAFDARERAVLEWTEAVTLIAGHGVSDEVYASVSKVFSKAELANLTVAVAAINVWNRFAATFHYTPQPAA